MHKWHICNYYRFPTKNKTIRENWERFVQHTHKLPEPWKAASSCRICSDHFQLSDYILPPSSQGTCRLKKYAIPTTPISTSATSSDELHSMVYSNKRSLDLWIPRIFHQHKKFEELQLQMKERS